MTIHFIQQFYISKDKIRNDDLKKVYYRNLESCEKGVFKYHNLVEDEYTIEYINVNFKNKKLKPTTLLNINDRLTYWKALEYGYENSVDGDYIVISNADIVLDPLLFNETRILDERLPQALSRWQVDEKDNNNWDMSYVLNDLQMVFSQDTWIFKRDNNLKSFIDILPNKDLTFGLYGGDNEFNCYIWAHYDKIFNDFNYYKTYHYHGLNNFREWKADKTHPFGYMLLIYGDALFVLKCCRITEGLWIKETEHFNEFILRCLRVQASFEESNGIKLKIEEVVNCAKNIKPLSNQWLIDNIDNLKNTYFNTTLSKNEMKFIL